ncbi:uncharacterized protein CIMG_13322 [Coccidioides immitis RS]|uniref:Uncharacterized protein n=1 Tax=Coccidioides immitis (strain RS) TaxID=246410 RepID=A0A0D8JU95_COCIM|nr:uncharacterized protein CIMG_13322 [Coccidioides immitis RS]KJF60920.1 hypothetical protein CIMG_13322 [Coccidioides immitis RS]
MLTFSSRDHGLRAVSLVCFQPRLCAGLSWLGLQSSVTIFMPVLVLLRLSARSICLLSLLAFFFSFLFFPPFRLFSFFLIDMETWGKIPSRGPPDLWDRPTFSLRKHFPPTTCIWPQDQLWFFSCISSRLTNQCMKDSGRTVPLLLSLFSRLPFRRRGPEYGSLINFILNLPIKFSPLADQIPLFIFRLMTGPAKKLRRGAG